MMKLTWLGHACFLLEQDGYTLIVDPYTGVEGYPPLQATAHAVYCSHAHADHNASQCVELLPKVPCPFTVRTATTFHDEQGGTLRGSNTVHIFTANGISIAHLGDLGHQLTSEQLDSIGNVDGVLVPVGGFYTVNADAAKAVCDSLSPRFIVPMHYHHAPYGLKKVAGVDDFLSLYPSEHIHRLSGNTADITAETSGILVPSFSVSE